jgi:hypothetical protein
MTPKKSSNKQAARTRSVPRRPRGRESDAEPAASEVDPVDEDLARALDDTGDADDVEQDIEADIAATLAAKRKAHPKNMPLPPPTPQRVAREGEEDELPDEVLEFVRAIDAYKRAKGRQFPSWSEVLDVLKQLGYERRTG